MRQLATLGLAQARTNKKKFDLASWLFQEAKMAAIDELRREQELLPILLKG